ncbi:hypothetical protein SLEP1_g29719 [Rubroshorea leprosula]|uniref:Uncharacterized protein n=1 Tax=Rubroshorea leprosula TaxID=152421 RepID=A0AAV5K6X3_9ROSI|nr:hypothetical protein SLEP1_g29719 [Rubroshorea leprosula]
MNVLLVLLASVPVATKNVVDTHIQQLDQYLKRFDEELRRERENAAATAVLPTTSLDGSVKSGSSEGGRGGRKVEGEGVKSIHSS